MRVVRGNVQVRSGESLHLHHITDTHTGAPDFDEESFLDRRELIVADPRAVWTMGGDGTDGIWHRDKRYSPTELDPRYRLATDVRLASKEHLVDLFAPIADKCVGWADGNHERTLDNYYGGKFGVEVCCALGIESKYVGYRGFVVLQIDVTSTQSRSLLLDLQHGWQAGRSKGTPITQAERELGTTEADVILRGHNHSPAAHTFVTLGVSLSRDEGLGKITRRYRTLVNGGCWRLGYREVEDIDPERMSMAEGDLWGETKGFRAEPIGGPILAITPTGGSRSTPSSLEHTIIEGHITPARLGL